MNDRDEILAIERRDGENWIMFEPCTGQTVEQVESRLFTLRLTYPNRTFRRATYRRVEPRPHIQD